VEKEIGFCLDSEKEKAEYLNIKEISFLSEILDWTSQIYLPAIENPNFFNKSIQGKMPNFFTSYEIIGGYGSRITFRYYNVKTDSISLNTAPVKK